ncbi:hypothetical protein SAMN03159485_04767 [Pseudomonas sp. NFPP24]|nr:hypothetical protein SAMN03159485_04767 [Pseudomonas sp. NFPP24]
MANCRRMMGIVHSQCAEWHQLGGRLVQRLKGLDSLRLEGDRLSRLRPIESHRWPFSVPGWVVQTSWLFLRGLCPPALQLSVNTKAVLKHEYTSLNCSRQLCPEDLGSQGRTVIRIETKPVARPPTWIAARYHHRLLGRATPFDDQKLSMLQINTDKLYSTGMGRTNQLRCYAGA